MMKQAFGFDVHTFPLNKEMSIKKYIRKTKQKTFVSQMQEQTFNKFLWTP